MQLKNILIAFALMFCSHIYGDDELSGSITINKDDLIQWGQFSNSIIELHPSPQLAFEIVDSKSMAVFAISPKGDIFWKGRKVKTDKELRRAVIQFGEYITGQLQCK